MIDDALTAFLEEGLAIHLATRNDGLEPHGARVTAVKVDSDRLHVVAYVPAVAARLVLADLEANGQAALGLGRPVDDRACQIKGTFASSWRARAAERAVVMTQWEGFLRQLDTIGLPGVTTREWRVWPAVAVRIRVHALFNQTPGPGAGTPLT